jgi:hypothetical protein
MVHHGEGAMVEDDGRVKGVDGDLDDQVLPDPETWQGDDLDVGDNDFDEEALGVESSAAGEERAARQAAWLLARRTALGAGAIVVNKLSVGLDNMYYTIACKNFFTSPALFEELLWQGIYGVGTIWGYRVGFPKSLNVGDNEVRGTLHVRIHRDHFMSVVHWTDCKGVAFLSTAANPYEPGCEVGRTVGVERITLPCTP